MDVVNELEDAFDDITIDLSKNFLNCSSYPNMTEYCNSDSQLSCGDFALEDVCEGYPPCSYDTEKEVCVFGVTNNTLPSVSSFLSISDESSESVPDNNTSSDSKEAPKNVTVNFFIKLSSDDFPGMTDTRIHDHIKKSVTQDICKNLGLSEDNFDVSVRIEYAKTRSREMQIWITVIFTGEDAVDSADSLVEKKTTGTIVSSTPYLKDSTIVSIDHGDRSVQVSTNSGLPEVSTGGWVGFGVAAGVLVIVIIVEISVVTRETKKQRAREAAILAAMQEAKDSERAEANNVAAEVEKPSATTKKSSSSSSETSSFSSADIFSGVYNESESDESSDSDESTSEDEN